MTIDPIRVSGLVRRSTLRLVGPCSPSLDAASRCLESVSTTDVHVTSTRDKHHLWRLPAERRGKTRQRSTSRPPSFQGRFRHAVRGRRRTTLRSSSLRQRRARRHDAGFGPIDCHARACARAQGKTAAALSAGGQLRRYGPSGAFHERLERGVSPCSSRVSSFRSGHVDAADFPELEAPSTVGDPARTLFREPMWSAARRWPAGAVAARVHRC